MCGIAGYLTNGEPVRSEAVIRAMCSRLEHRGPDGEGYFCEGPVALGQRRLSIIDIEGGRQPMGNEDESIQVVYNGEIYNHRELREDLVKKGHQFRTRSDTEVLVHLYEEVGERLPEYLNGMFALAIWDSRRREMLLARDRFGEKPLYYTAAAAGYRFCFASELKAFNELAGFAREVNERAVADFLALGYVPDPDSIYRDVYKLAPAHRAMVGARGIRIDKYWAPDFSGEPQRNFGSAVEETRAMLADAVERRMISDVPLGAFLSGGVDSSAVVGFMAASAKAPVKTFSIGFTYENYDELRFARLSAERHQTDHREHVITPDVEEILDTVAYYYDEPFGDSSAIPCLYLANMTRQHVTVALSGDGADELFCGYRRYKLAALEHRLRRVLPRWFRQSAVRLAGEYYPKFDYLPQVLRAKTLLNEISMEIGDAYYHSMACFNEPGLRAILPQEQAGGYTPKSRFQAYFRTVQHLPALEQLQAVDLQTYLPGDILVKMDRASMAYSLEARAPMLDHRLAHLAFHMPGAFKLRGGVGKAVLKRAVSGVVPEAAIKRRKMGFQVPLAGWLRTSLKPVFERSVLRPDMERYVRVAEARRLWVQHQSGLHNHDRKLWNLLMLALWDERYQKPTQSAPAKIKMAEELARR